MPRIYSSCSDPLDFCRDCFPDEDEAETLYGDVAKTGEGPDGRGNCYSYDDDHPPYQDTEYRCETCNRPLTDGDNERDGSTWEPDRHYQAGYSYACGYFD